MSPRADPERQRRLAALADWHHDWVMGRVDGAPFAPAGRKPGSDYNQHFVDIDDDDDEFHDRARQILGLDDSDDLGKSARSVATGHDQLHHYWTREAEGLAKWADHPHPWTALYHHLLKYLPPEEAKRTAANWFRDVKGYWPGDQKGKNPVGPG